MCWVGTEAIQKIAEKDFYVYKIGRVVWNGIFVSYIKNFVYNPKCSNKIIPLTVQIPCRGTCVIQEGYHSYKWIAFDNTNPYERCLYLGNYNLALKENVSLYKHCYIATFIIPKGATYIINTKGEIVSDKIIYTGKYLKL